MLLNSDSRNTPHESIQSREDYERMSGYEVLQPYEMIHGYEAIQIPPHTSMVANEQVESDSSMEHSRSFRRDDQHGQETSEYHDDARDAESAVLGDGEYEDVQSYELICAYEHIQGFEKVPNTN